MARSIHWPTNRRRLLWRRQCTKHGNHRKSPLIGWICAHQIRHGYRAINRGRLEYPGRPVIAIVRAIAAVWKMRCMQVAAPIGGIPRNATDAIRWGASHGIAQTLGRWRVEHWQRQRQQKDDVENINWELLNDSYASWECIDGQLVLGLYHHFSHLW